MRKGYPDGCLTVFGNLFIFRCRRCRPLVVAMGTAGETACPTLLNQSFGEVGGAGGFACQWKLISIGHPNSENGYAPTLAWLNQLRLGVESLNRFLYASLRRHSTR